MSIEKFPENTTVSLEDFRKCGWLEAIHEAKREDYRSMWQALTSFARKAIEEERYPEGKVLWLLADSCSMMLKPSSHNEPFAPFKVMEEKRSIIPEDFQPEDIAFFAEIAEEITDSKLRARISDITWLMKKPRDATFALKAIDAYLQMPLMAENWSSDELVCKERAIQLCKLLKAGSGTRLMEIESQLVESIKNSTKEDGYFALKLSELLAKYGQSNHQLAISEKLEILATEFENVGDIYHSRDYFIESSNYYTRLGNPDKSAEMTVKVAEAWVKEALAQQASDSPNNMVAANFYENAILTYRKVPKAYRANHNLDNRIAELRTELNLASQNSLSEMATVSSGPIDIRDLVENARNSVSGKNSFDALLALANLYPGAKVRELRESAERSLRKYFLSSLFSGTHLSKDGRVVAKSPAANLGGELDETRVWAKMVEKYTFEIELVVQSQIWPAFETIQQEHRIKEMDFYSVVKQSPVVPEGRERLIAKALFSGYDNDFVTALHLLIPQIEHLVRFHLKQAGVKTSNLDKNGIETENGLTSLMENPEVNTIFGEDLAFELKALFCDAFGPNLRNELAHGLLDYEECQSVYAFYAWWLGLRI
ncbi:MAG: DUF4209 domain-containing protein, partial [Methylobacter sp.]